MSDDPFGDAVRAAVPVDYLRAYGASVLAQDAGDGLLTVRCDDPRVGELARVPLCVGIVGARVLVDAGTRVKIKFEGGDPELYYATGIGQDLGASKGVARVGDLCDAGTVEVKTGPSGGVLITYKAPGDLIGTSVVIAGLVTATPTIFSLIARITSGHPDVLLTDKGQ